MIFQSFLLGNFASLTMKLMNSVVVVGLCYGFLTTLSIGPSDVKVSSCPAEVVIANT